MVSIVTAAVFHGHIHITNCCLMIRESFSQEEEILAPLSISSCKFKVTQICPEKVHSRVIESTKGAV